MSTTYSVNVILGVRVPESELFTVVENKHEHPYPDGAKFCPECGESTNYWTTHKPIWTDDINDYFYKPFFGKTRIIKQGSDCFIGHVVSVNCEEERKCYHVLESWFSSIKSELNTALQKYNLLKYMDSFGIYAFPEIS